MTWTKRRPATARTSIAVRAAVSATAVAACGLLLAACSSSAAAPSTQAKPAASSSAGAKGMDAYRQCLAQHGVTMAPRPSGSGRPEGAGRPSGAARRPGAGGGFGGFGAGPPRIRPSDRPPRPVRASARSSTAGAAATAPR